MTQQPGTEFDFFLGEWTVHHRRLTTRLAGADDWQEFSGETVVHPILNGLGNMDDNILNHPEDPYRAISLRSFDPATKIWAIWWLDGRTPHDLDVPVKGQFQDRTGMFYAEDTMGNRPIKMRFTWTRTATASPRWEQAFSPDGGATWETNWIMDFTRKQA